MSLDWSTAVLDWEQRIVGRESLIPDLPLDDTRAGRALRLFKALKVPDIEGNPTYGEVCGDWVFRLVAAVFGAFDAETNTRFIREYFVLIPKKNGKTSIAAAIIVVALMVNERPSAEALLIAPTQKIAEMAFDQAEGIIKISATASGTPLLGLFALHRHIKAIDYLSDSCPSKMSIKAADADVITGSKATYILIDETHVFASNTRAAGVFKEIRGGLSHPQNKGFLLQITTQSKVAPAGVFKAELDRARKVRDGKIILPLLPVLYELPIRLMVEDGWRDPETWSMVNPHLGRSVSADFLREELLAAETDGPEALALHASQHLNVQIGLGLSQDAWDGARHWLACGKDGLDLDEILRNCDVATIGADWGGADDLASLAVLGRRRHDKTWMVWSMSWARPSVFDRRKEIAPRLKDFVAAGDLRVVETGEQQAIEAAEICARVKTAGILPESAGIGLDVAGVALLIDALEARQMAAPLVCPVAQGWKLQTAISTLPLKLEDKRLIHGNQGLLSWAVGNAKQELKGSNYIVTKQIAGAAKIDPLIALFNASMLMFLNPMAAPVARIRIA